MKCEDWEALVQEVNHEFMPCDARDKDKILEYLNRRVCDGIRMGKWKPQPDSYLVVRILYERAYADVFIAQLFEIDVYGNERQLCLPTDPS